MSKIHIIAEAGTNHNASEQVAQQLIDVAVAAQADSVKFQIIYPEGLYVSKIFDNGAYKENEVIAIRRAGMLSDDSYRNLASYSNEKSIPMSASVFCADGLSLLREFDPPYVKIASCDLNNTILLKRATELGCKLIVSTGMATLGEVERAVTDITSTGFTDLVLMHCVSVYPCPTEQMNLRFIETLKTAFGFPVGLSDHTENSLAAAAAIPMGIEWIEKHYTLDRSSTGFDHAYAMEPAMLKQYISDVRAIEAAYNYPEVKIGEIESNVKIRARRGLYATRDIPLGKRITADDVAALRPESEYTPQQLDLVVGHVASREIKELEPFTSESIQENTLSVTAKSA